MTGIQPLTSMLTTLLDNLPMKVYPGTKAFIVSCYTDVLYK